MFSARTNVEGTRASSGSCVRFECRFYTDVAPVVLEERRRKSEVDWGGGSGSSVCLINERDVFLVVIQLGISIEAGEIWD